MKVLVTGAAGQLGVVMVQRSTALGHDVVALARKDLDITSAPEVQRVISEARPDVVLNCAAYNDVDDAEEQALAALDVNAHAVRWLARAAGGVHATLVHYGTDFVFDGRASAPYSEDDTPNPQSVYGASKLLGEWFAADVPRHYVLRVESLFGGPASHSSIDRIVEALAAGRAARVFADRVVSPSYVDDVATATLALIDIGAPFGLYHCVNGGHGTWLDVGREIAGRLGVPEERLEPVSVRDVPLRAARPQFAALSNGKLRRAGVEMPDWRDAVRRHLAARRR